MPKKEKKKSMHCQYKKILKIVSCFKNQGHNKSIVSKTNLIHIHCKTKGECLK
jgi:hypothetical protein